MGNQLLPLGITAALSLALSQVIQDPYLIWTYAAVGVACLVATIICPMVFKDLDTWPTDFKNDRRETGDQGEAAMLEGSTS